MKKQHLAKLVCLVLGCLLLPAGDAKASLSQENLKTYIGRVGARVDSVKGNMFITTHGTGKSRVEIRLLNDNSKQRLGFYVFGLGNVANAGNVTDLYSYLLQANSELAIGTFFVDKDLDIGYKFLIDTRDPLSFETFSITYLAMVNVLKERGPAIGKMLTKDGAAPRPDAEPEDTEGEPAGTPPADEPGDGAASAFARLAAGRSGP